VTARIFVTLRTRLESYDFHGHSYIKFNTHTKMDCHYDRGSELGKIPDIGGKISFWWELQG